MTHTLKVGDILTSIWGYDQTNVDFYEVLKVTGSFITIQKRNSEATYDGYMTGKVVPGEGFCSRSKAIRRKVIFENGCKITSYAWAKPWNGQPKSFSSYA